MFKIALWGGATERPNWSFAADFIIFPIWASYLVFQNLRSAECILWAFLGFIGFTLVEYWAHRVPLHTWFYHGSHERHHTHPKEYVVFPIYATPIFFFAVGFILPVAIFAGFLIGYIWFLTWHFALHHLDLNAWPQFVRRYALWHLAHHHDESCNFGITIPIWDLIFGTYRKV